MDQKRLAWVIYGAGVAFNVSYLMLALLIPIDAIRLGFDTLTVGLVTSVPGILQLPLRILSGPLTDYWGERRVLSLTFTLSTLAGVAAGFVSPHLVGLLAGQLLIGAARGMFWTAAQSFASRLPGDAAHTLGRFTSFTKGGALIGIAIAGSVASLVGIPMAFGLSAVLSLVALGLAIRMPRWSPNAKSGRFLTIVVGLWPAAKRPFVMANGFVAFLTAVPQALAQSFYPVALIHWGVSASLASAITAVQSLGMIAAGVAAPHLLHRVGAKRLSIFSGLLLSAGLLLTAFHTTLVAAVAIGIAGLAAGALNVSFLTNVIAQSRNAERGTNLGVTQVYFVLAMILTPLLSGILASHIALSPVFLLEGITALIITILVSATWAWSHRDGKRLV